MEIDLVCRVHFALPRIWKMPLNRRRVTKALEASLSILAPSPPKGRKGTYCFINSLTFYNSPYFNNTRPFLYTDFSRT